MPLLFFLIFLFLFPWFFLLLILLFYVLIPLGFTLQAFLWLLYEPARLLRTVTSRKTRMNHALMHATINVLEEERGSLNLEGIPLEDGFSLRGKMDPDLVLLAGREALQRVNRGETSLILYRRCGISVLLSNTLLAFTVFILLRIAGAGGLLSAVLALVTAYFAGSRIGLLTQSLGAVSTNLDGMEITGVEISGERVAFGGMTFFSPVGVTVRTRTNYGPRVAEVVYP